MTAERDARRRRIVNVHLVIRWIRTSACRVFGHRAREFTGSDYLATVRPDGALDRRVDYTCPRCGDVEQRWQFGGDRA